MKLPSSFPQLTTYRLQLRALQAGDASDLWEMLRQPAATQYYDVTLASLSQAEQYIRLQEHRFSRGESLLWGMALWDEAQLIGVCGIDQHQDHNDWARVRFLLAPAYWRQGLMLEALTAVLQYGFVRPQIRCFEADLLPGNHRASKLLLRLGFSAQGSLQDGLYLHGRHYDLERFLLTRVNFQPVTGELGV